MCSICGMIDFIDSKNVSREEVVKMGSTVKHRGIDQSDCYVSENVAFQHNRLSVIDIDNGRQPMTVEYGGKKYTIVYNGEIYNYGELKRELSPYDIKLKTYCDTELVLYSYIIFGEQCAAHLNGIFAFCVYDHDKNSVFLARDRFGIKPLFYSLCGSTLLFASEIKALLASSRVSRRVDKYGLWQLMFLSPVTINGSGIFKDISELKPAECAVFDADGFNIKKYWRLKAKELNVTSEQAAEHTRELMCDAIRGQLVSNVPLCTFLSGGLDSSVITAVAAREYARRGEILSTYSFEYEGNHKNFKKSLFQPAGDDEFAVYLANYLGTEHTVLTAPTETVAAYLTKATKYRDFPGQADIDSSLLFFCEQVKRKHTVALSGECSDEIFGGYPWFYRPEMLYKDFFPWIHEPMLRVGLFDPAIAKPNEGYEYISSVYKNSLAECPVIDSDTDASKTARYATWLSVNYFMTSLLERKDRMSMASSLEVRVPFADHRILEYVFNVPWEIKFENNVEKALLRNAMKDYLPDKILYRKKSPYPKTHNPKYEELVTEMLTERLARGGILSRILNQKVLGELLCGENTTWFGQLMSRPQLIAWLIQLDYWFEEYNVEIV